MSTESMVTQADRDAAADVAWKSPKFLAELRAGQHDDCDAVQAFARHRTAAQPEREAVLEEAARVADQCAISTSVSGEDYPYTSHEARRFRARADESRIIAAQIRALKTTPAPVSRAEIVAALKPFAAKIEYVEFLQADDGDFIYCAPHTAGDYRRARAILARLGEGE